MKKLVLFSLTILAALNISYAQDNVNERIQEARENFFTEALQLTPEESKAFWPIYNQFHEDEKKLEKQYRPDSKVELMSDEEVEQHINSIFEMEEKQIALKRNYVERLKKVIPVRKVAMLPRTEKQFKRELLKKIRDRREQGNNRKPGRTN